MKLATRFAALALLVFTTASAFAQPTNKEAKQLLTEASEKLKSYKNIFLGFNYTFENKKVQPPVVQKETGSIGIKGTITALSLWALSKSAMVKSFTPY